jgi:membrane-anchored protein YejM (alkaline phosphatase superfamily)
VAHVYEIGLLDDSAYKKTLGDFDHPHSRFQQFPLQPIRMQEDHDLEREERIRLRERRRGRQR